MYDIVVVECMLIGVFDVFGLWWMLVDVLCVFDVLLVVWFGVLFKEDSECVSVVVVVCDVWDGVFEEFEWFVL